MHVHEEIQRVSRIEVADMLMILGAKLLEILENNFNTKFFPFQLKEIDAELETCTDLERRNTLMDLHSDLIELIALLTGKAISALIHKEFYNFLCKKFQIN